MSTVWRERESARERFNIIRNRERNTDPEACVFQADVIVILIEGSPGENDRGRRPFSLHPRIIIPVYVCVIFADAQTSRLRSCASDSRFRERARAYIPRSVSYSYAHERGRRAEPSAVAKYGTIAPTRRDSRCTATCCWRWCRHTALVSVVVVMPRNSRRAIRETGETLPAGSRRRGVLDNACPVSGSRHGCFNTLPGSPGLAPREEERKRRPCREDLFVYARTARDCERKRE